MKKNLFRINTQMTPFMTAAVAGQIEVLQLLFELAKPIVNLPDVRFNHHQNVNHYSECCFYNSLRVTLH